MRPYQKTREELEELDLDELEALKEEVWKFYGIKYRDMGVAILDGRNHISLGELIITLGYEISIEYKDKLVLSSRRQTVVIGDWMDILDVEYENAKLRKRTYLIDEMLGEVK